MNNLALVPPASSSTSPSAPTLAPSSPDGAARSTGHDDSKGDAHVSTLLDGARVSVDAEAVEIRDAGGRLLVRYADGNAEISAPAGDLRLSAPGGGVVIDAAQQIAVQSGDTRLQLDASGCRLDSPRMDVHAQTANLTGHDLSVAAQHIATTAATLTQRVERLEVNATRIIERTRDAFREVKGLWQTRAGRVRTLVEDGYRLRAKRTAIHSENETSIDGSAVLLG